MAKYGPRQGRFPPNYTPWNKGMTIKANERYSAAEADLKKKSRIGEEIGGTGTLVTSGFISSTDYNNDLTGVIGIDTFDEMRLGDATVRAAMMAVKLPIMSANWFVTPGSDEDRDKEVADFIHENLFELASHTWSEFLRQALLSLDFGRMVFEIVYELRDGMVWVKKLAPRLPRTIYQWEMSDGENGITQLLPNGKSAHIPIEKLIIFTNEKEGDNWEGISLLRAAYPSWYYKNQLYKIDAIAHERQGIGVPIFKLGDSASDKDRTKAEEFGKNLRANEESHYVLEGDVNLEMLDMKSGSTSKPMQSILHHDRQIVKSVLAQFLELGASGGSGSRALSEDHSQLFMLSLESIAKQVADAINTYLIRRLVDLNFDVSEYPRLEFSKMSQENMDAFATAMQKLVQSGVLKPDEKIEDLVRDRFDLPEKQDSLPDDERNVPSEQEQEEIATMKERVDAAIKAIEKSVI